MKKALRETQTLRGGYSKAKPKNFAPPQTPFPGAQDASFGGGHYIYLQTQFGEDRCTQLSYRGNRPTNAQTHPPTHPQTGPITIHCAAAG